MLDRKKVYLITSNAEAGTLESLPATAPLEIIDSDDLVRANLRFSKHDKVCIASEAAIEKVIEKIDDLARIKAIELLKNKYAFRQILTAIYPDLQYQFIQSHQIQDLKITQKSVIKPVKGVFGTAVRIIDRNTNLTELAAELQTELTKNTDLFSASVLSTTDFIVESYIDGEEYAVDMFYNSSGEACIVNIYHHPLPQNLAYLHVIYYSSQAVFDLIYAKAKQFFTELNGILKVTNLPIHGEFKLDGVGGASLFAERPAGKENRLMPIELNSLRFGGMGLGNLAFHGLGVDPYACFAEDIEPDWPQIWQDKPADIFAFFIAYNGANINVLNCKPDREKLKRQFTKVLLERNFDYQNQLAFGIYILKETKQNLSRLLQIEFDDFFELTLNQSA
jgi:ATP-grasp domain